MKPVIVFGTGDFADIVSFILEEKLGLSIAAYAVHERFRQEDSYRGRPLVALEECQCRFSPASFDAALAIIGKKMFTQREAVFSDLVKMGYRIRNVIDPRASLDTDRIGQGNIILAGASIEAHCSIGTGISSGRTWSFPTITRSEISTTWPLRSPFPATAAPATTALSATMYV